MHEQVQRHLEGPFEHHLFDAALRNLANQEEPLPFNTFAYSIREPGRLEDLLRAWGHFWGHSENDPANSTASP